MILKTEIYNFIKQHGDWVHGSPIEKLAWELQHKAATAGRQCRYLYKEGKLERKLCDCAKPKHVVYRAKTEPNEQQLEFIIK